MRLKTLFDARKDLTQKELGTTCGIGTGGMVSQYLNAKRPISLHTAIKFAKGLGVSVADISPTLAAQLPSGEWTPHVNPSLHHASSGASAPATLQNALEFLAGYLSALDAGDRARAVRDIADLADEPQAVAKITARIEAMASPAFTDKKRSNG